MAARLAVSGAGMAMGVGVGCAKDTVITTRPVIANVPASCAVDGQGYATYFALGDFEPPAPPPGPYLEAVGTVLTQIDARTRALFVTATEGSDTWEGVTPVPASGDVNVLVLPQDRSCALSTTVGARTGSALGVIGSQRALLVGGDDPRTVPGDFVVRLDTGQVEAVPGTRELTVGRRQASVTAFGAGGLVAGGFALGTGLPTDDAQVFDPDAGGFTTRLSLSQPRAAHAAVVLVDGETLLVGGVGGADGKTPLESLELVDPAGGNGHVEGLGKLMPILTSPRAIRLASGEVLVAGGTQAAGVAVTGLQWFTAAGQRSMVSPQTLPAGAGVTALVALSGGGALAVVAPAANAPAGFQNTWVVSADHAVAPAVPVPGALTAPVLFGGAGGAPLLWTGDRWLQWQPWAGAFAAAPVLDTVGAHVGEATASPDPGLAMWLDPTRQKLVALRSDATGPYAADLAPLLVSGPAGIAPDRLPGGAGVSYNGGSGLTLAGTSSAFLTDRTYADVSIRVTYAAGQAPLVVLRDALGIETVIDDRCCPGLFTAAGPEPVVDVERAGATVTCAVSGAAPTTCAASLDPAARLTVGVRGALPTTPSVVEKIVVVRVGEP